MTAEACVQAALYDCAVEQLALASVDPVEVTPALLKMDPIWDPLRGRPDFQKLLDDK